MTNDKQTGQVQSPDADELPPPTGHSRRDDGFRWHNFLVGDTEASTLRAFEILFTGSFLVWMGRCFCTWREWLTDAGFHLSADELAMMGYPPPFPLLSGMGVASLGATIALAGAAHIFNIFRRLSLAVLLGAAVYVQGADLMAAFTLNKLYVGVYGILLFTPGYFRDPTTHRLMVSAVPMRLIQATLILQYLAAGMGKAFGGEWLDYSDVLYTQVQGVYRTEIAAWCLRNLPVWSWTIMQWTALLFELEAPLLFCVRKLRPVAFVIGMGFHLMIALFMKDLIYFSLQMWTFYALFVSPNEWRAIGRVLARLLRRKSSATEASSPA